MFGIYVPAAAGSFLCRWRNDRGNEMINEIKPNFLTLIIIILSIVTLQKTNTS